MYKFIDGQAYALPDEGVELTAEQYAWALAHPGATEAEVLVMQLAPPPAPTLQELRSQKLSALNAWNTSAIAAGYTDPEGRTWGIADADRRAWGELLMSLETVLRAPDSYVIASMREVNGLVIHSDITFGEFKVIMQGVAQAYMMIDATYAALRAAILTAADEGALDAITIPA